MNNYLLLSPGYERKQQFLQTLIVLNISLVNPGRRYVRYRGRRRRVKIRRKYFFGLKRRPILNFRRKLRIFIRRKYRKIKRFGRRWRVRIRRRWCGLRRFGRKWYLKRRRKWRKVKRVRLTLKWKGRRIRIRRRRKVWYLRRKKRWRLVKRRVRCSIRVRRRRVRVKLVGRRRVRIFRKGRFGKTRRIRFRRELIQIWSEAYHLVQGDMLLIWYKHYFSGQLVLLCCSCCCSRCRVR